MSVDLSHGVFVALGGGGMRGVAHLGVLSELEAEGVRVRGIAGASSGSLLGALWLTAGTEAGMQRVREFVTSGRARKLPDFGESGQSYGLLRKLGHAARLVRALALRHMLTTAEMLDQVAFFLPEVDIGSLRVPFLAVAADSRSGDEVRLGSGPLREAVAASSAMPGLVPPIPWSERLLQDGGSVAEIPVPAARSLGSPVLAVETSEGLPPFNERGDRLPRALFRAAAMGWQALRRRLVADADGVIAPAVNHIHWADFNAVDEAVAAGRVAARAFRSTC